MPINLKAHSLRFNKKGGLVIEYDYIGKPANFNPLNIGVLIGYDYNSRPIPYNLGFVKTRLPDPQVSGSRISYTIDLSDIPLSMTIDQLKKGNLFSLNIDFPSNKIAEANENDNRLFMELPFIRKIPQIMKNQGPLWNIAADFQQRWFSGNKRVWPAEKLLSKAFSKASDSFYVESIDPRWLFDRRVDTNSRARNAFNGLLKKDSLFSANAVKEINKLVNSEFNLVSGRSKPDEFTFGLPNNYARSAGIAGFKDISLLPYPETKYNARYAKALVETYFQKSEQVNTGSAIDPLTGALGKFSFYATATGSAARIDVPKSNPSYNKYNISIDSIEIYMIDVFEFNGSQPLGYWDPITGPTLLPTNIGDNGGLGVWNSDYNDYRDATGKGEDFIIVSSPIYTMPSSGRFPKGIFDSDTGKISWRNLDSNWIPIDPLLFSGQISV